MTTPISYETFELLIGERTEAGYSVRVLDSPHGQAKGLLQLDEDALAELIDALEVIEARETDIDTLTQIGEFLFDALFAGDILLLYRQSLAVVHGQESRLRVRLHIEPPTLAALPWEFLHDAQTSSFLAIAPETALMRFIPMKLPVRASAIEPPLRILAVISNPDGVVPLDVAQEKRILQEALQPQIDAGRIQLQVIDKARIEAINQAMRSDEPHIFHFVGHGLFDGDQAYVILEDDDGMAKPVDETVFREIFAASKETRLAVLNACQTATTSSTRPLAGLAPNLLQRKLSAVIAMQYTVADKAALIFARDLYRSLALGLPLEAAVSEARKAIYMECGPDMPDWGTPVLFLRAKDGQLFDVAEPASTPAAPEIPPPPPPMKPPVAEDFVGREAELAYFGRMLAEVNLAVVAGMPGVGKTAVAAQVAVNAGSPDKTFWHGFHAGEGVDILIWKLAAFLAFNGQGAPWQMLQSTTLSGGQLPPPDVLFDYLFQAIRGQDYLICLDDFQRVEADPLLEKLVDRLHPAVIAGDLRLILSTQQVPSFVQSTQFNRLTGMGLADAGHLLARYGVILPGENLTHLHTHTGGNAELLVLAANSLKGAADPEDVVNRLTSSADVERFLLSEVDGTLDEEERLVMSGVAVLLGMPGSRNAIEEVLDGSNVRRTLSYLANRYLLETLDSPQEREYAQHSVVQNFYYDLLSRRERRGMHLRAANYYAYEEMDDLRAARHYQAAGEDIRAAEILSENALDFVAAGKIGPVKSLLGKFQQRRFADNTPLWVRLMIAQSLVDEYLGDRGGAEETLHKAIDLLDTVTDQGSVAEIRIALYRTQARIVSLSKPLEAEEWINKGMAELPNVPKNRELLEGDFLALQGAVYSRTGRSDAALAALTRALEILPRDAAYHRMGAMIRLGVTCFLRGEHDLGVTTTQNALAIAQRIHNYHYEMVARSNIATFQHMAGQWEEAAHNYRKSLASAEQLGNLKETIRIGGSLSVLYIYLGDLDKANNLLMDSLIICRKHQMNDEILLRLNYLSQIALLQGNYAHVPPMLAEAEALSSQTGLQVHTPMRMDLAASLALLTDDLPEALARAQEAVSHARRLKMPTEEGQALRTLGVIQIAQSQVQEGLDAFERSLAILESTPYEAALTKLAWGEALIGLGDESTAVPMLEEAEEAFVKLGAQHYMSRVKGLLD